MDKYNRFIIARYRCGDLCRWVPAFQNDEKVWYEGPEGELTNVTNFRKMCLARIEEVSMHSKEYFQDVDKSWIDNILQAVSKETELWNHNSIDPGTDDIREILDCVSKFMILLQGGCRH